ncbi:hypothetical protein FISHEDRAFT_50843 [Fistulina hepatica ATCC 64428]|uniref:Mitochondrial inner membrane protease ATP23 n=1 Tax=Fistulina hepatica ATCC 64428 TaxID=1128425 RepID=A0A0D7A2N0_9AGAR|nr:hypothetical protein FISHEDRAFT_50843 [Fistulina hepatica ATCC 64428]
MNGDDASSSDKPTPSKRDEYVPISGLTGFEKWRRTMAFLTGIGISEGDRARELANVQINNCEADKHYLMQASPSVVFMLKHLKVAGCELPPSNIVCAPCEGPLSHVSGFVPDDNAILLCAGRFWSRKHLEQSMVHEMMHFYDNCRFKVKWDDLRHHACSEIRANNLSGDCSFLRQLRRAEPGFFKKHQECVRSRAILSVSQNPNCPDVATAERAVNEVWDSCFPDTRPFDEVCWSHTLLTCLRLTPF